MDKDERTNSNGMEKSKNWSWIRMEKRIGMGWIN